MDTRAALAQIEGAVADHLALSGADPAVEAAMRALLNALQPALRQVAYDLAQQAAHEVAAQLPNRDVEVVLEDGEPVLKVRASSGAEPVIEDLDARLTLRMPASLKIALEEAAQQLGDSVNSFVVKSLSGQTRGGRPEGPDRHVSGTIRL
jgi:hypothetical protein